MVRVVLAAAVLVTHYEAIFRKPSGWPTVGGTAAVEMFFVISGLYMGLVLTTRYTPESGPGWRRRFYLARYFRLFPVYAVVAMATAAGSVAAVGGRWNEVYWLTTLGRMDGWAAALAVASDATLIGQDVPGLLALDPEGGVRLVLIEPAADPGWLAPAAIVGHAWTLGTELWFYLLAPWLVRRTWAVLGGLLAASFALKWGLELGIGMGASARFFPAQLCLFLCGLLSHRVGGRVPGWVGVGAIAAAVGVTLTAGWWGAGPGTWANRALPFGFAALAYPAFAVSARWEWDRTIGEMSYPAYMVHMLVLHAFRLTVGDAAGFIAVLLATAVAAAGLYVVVEVPCDRVRRRMTTPPHTKLDVPPAESSPCVVD